MGNHSSPTRQGKRFWMWSRIADEDCGDTSQMWHKFSIFWLELSPVKTHWGRCQGHFRDLQVTDKVSSFLSDVSYIRLLLDVEINFSVGEMNVWNTYFSNELKWRVKPNNQEIFFAMKKIKFWRLLHHFKNIPFHIHETVCLKAIHSA